jgi:hypothetical protein
MVLMVGWPLMAAQPERHLTAWRAPGFRTSSRLAASGRRLASHTDSPSVSRAVMTISFSCQSASDQDQRLIFVVCRLWPFSSHEPNAKAISAKKLMPLLRLPAACDSLAPSTHLTMLSAPPGNVDATSMQQESIHGDGSKDQTHDDVA